MCVLMCFQITKNVCLMETWITLSSIFSRKVSLRAKVSIKSSYLYSKWYDAICFLITLFWPLLLKFSADSILSSGTLLQGFLCIFWNPVLS